jgi:hypothetical protein
MQSKMNKTKNEVEKETEEFKEKVIDPVGAAAKDV